MRHTTLAAAFFLAAGLARSEVRLTPANDTSYPANTIVELTADGADPKAGYIWDVFAPAGVTPSTREYRELRGRMLLAGPAGQYTVKVRTVTVGPDGVIQIETASKTFTIGPANPNPGPGPNPGPTPPDPTPPPGPHKLFMVVIEESSQQAEWRGAILADPTLAARIKERGHGWRLADKDQRGADGRPPADLAPYIALAGGKTLPQLFLVDYASGKIYYAGDAPSGADAAKKTIDLLAKFGG